jgi:hypothetical protein
MTTHRRWALPLAVAGGAAVGAVLALLWRSKRRHVAMEQDKENLQAWEGEGGSLVVPASAQSRTLVSPEQPTATRSQAR